MKRRQTSRLWLVTGGALLVLAFAVGPAAGGPAPNVGAVATPETTAVVGEPQEPACLNRYLACGSTDVTHLISSAVLAGAYRQRPDLLYEPVLVDHVDVETSPFALAYHLRSDAEWSDGVSVTADDLVFTLEALQNPSNDVLDRAGYGLITAVTKLDSKSVRFEFSDPFPAWKRLFPQILPKHVLMGQDFDTTLSNSIPVGSGPFVFESWQSGAEISLLRNEDWWGPHLARSSRVVFRFIPDTNARFEALTNGELTLLHPDPTINLLSLPSEIVVSTIDSRTVEHLDINVESSSMPLLGDVWFRRALAHALDRTEAAFQSFELLNPVMGGGVPVDDSLVYLKQHADYVPQFDTYAYSPTTVADLMQDNGCVLGMDGIWSCGGTRASVEFTTTTGNQVRADVQDALIASAAAAGIELVADNTSSADLFGVRLPARDFELVMFSWTLAGDPASAGLRGLYGCSGGSNHMSYCTSEVDALLDEAEVELNDAARAALFQELDEILTDDVPSIPLFERPTFLAQRPTIAGVVNNASPQGITWNIEEWRFPSAPFDVAADAPPNGVTGKPYSFSFELVNGSSPHVFVLADGTLPPGLTIAENGTLHGTPMAAGTYDFVVSASQCCGDLDAERGFTVTIREALAVTTPGLATGLVGAPYVATLGATGAGGVTLSWSVSGGSLPAGLTLAPSGTISGTPASPGVFAFAVKVSDTDGFVPDRSATKQLTLAVRAALAATAPTRRPTGIVGRPYAGGVPTATGGLAPYRWSLAAGAIAPGLSVNPATGALGGRPTRAGTFAYTLGVMDTEGRTATVGLNVSVVAALDVVTSRLPAARVGRAYRAKLASRGGRRPTTWKLTKGKLPAGLRLKPATGVLRGKPRTAGTFKFTVRASDALRQRSTQPLKLIVRR